MSVRTSHHPRLDTGPYDLVVGAGKEFEVERESTFIGAAKQMATVPIDLRLKPGANPAPAGAGNTARAPRHLS